MSSGWPLAHLVHGAFMAHQGVCVMRRYQVVQGILSTAKGKKREAAGER